MPPTSASDTVGQYNKIGSITFRAALIQFNISKNIDVEENKDLKKKKSKECDLTRRRISLCQGARDTRKSDSKPLSD